MDGLIRVLAWSYGTNRRAKLARVSSVIDSRSRPEARRSPRRCAPRTPVRCASAMRNRRKKRAVSLDQQAVERHDAGDFFELKARGNVTMPARER